MLNIIGNAIEYRYDSEIVRIEGWGPNGIRVRAVKQAEIPEDPGALLPGGEAEGCVTEGKGGMTLVNGKITASVDPAGMIVFRNAAGKVLLEEYIRSRKGWEGEGAQLVHSGIISALGIDAREFQPILGGDFHVKARFESVPEEKIYGMGQYQQPFLNLKGCELELAQRNSQASVPFMISSLGYGFLWNNPAVGQVSFAKNVTTWESFSTKRLDYWICAGDTPAEIEENYAAVTGTVPMMPEYGMGFWQCKLRYQTQEELLNIAREYKKRGIPLDVIVCDYFHWTRQGEWKFDEKFWQDPKAMVDELKEMGVELMVSIWPTVDWKSENYEEMVEKGYVIRNERGSRVAMGPPVTTHFDPTYDKAREYVWNKVKQNYYDKGIRIFWLDEAEPEYNFYDFDLYRYHEGPNVQIGNRYPYYYAKAFYDGMTKEGQTNIVNLIRCAWAGSQRMGALVWSGDIESSFRSFRNQFTAGLNMGIAGIPWWTTNIGGFRGGNPDDPAFRECFLRWFAYGAFCPVMRLHGVREPQKRPLTPELDYGGGCQSSGADNEVWSYGEEAYEICKKFIFLREKMRPYVRELMGAAHEKGSPVMRPLFYEFPEDAKAWECEDAYTFGPDMLVAPVMEAGAKERTVYLPEGAKWVHAWSGKAYEGGQFVTVAAPMDEIPVFLRDGKHAEFFA